MRPTAMMNNRHHGGSLVRSVKLAALLIPVVQLVVVLNGGCSIIQAAAAAADGDALGATQMRGSSNTGPPALGSLIDWRTYTKAFNKRYSSLSQQIVRNKLFVMNTIKVFLAAAKHKSTNEGYFLVINAYADMTPQEEQRKLSGDSGEYPSDDEAEDDEIMPDDEVKRILEAELEELQNREQQASELRASPSSSSSSCRKRPKRDTHKTVDADSIHQLDMSRLVRMPSANKPKHDESSSSSSCSATNIKWLVPSNNPHYVPIEPFTNGVSAPKNKRVDDIPEDQIKTIERQAKGWLSFRLPSFSDLTKKTYHWLSGSLGQPKHDSPSPSPPTPSGSIGGASDHDDESETSQSGAGDQHNSVIKDWRQSGCVSDPYDQGDCNSCYAVSAISFLEWAFCMNQNRVLTPLSAQYLVSCGPQFMEESDPRLKIQFYGCDKGRSRQAMAFVKEYGAELAAHMPYLADDAACPIEPNTPQKHKGYIRPNVRQHVRMSAATTQLEMALNVGPVIVNFREPIDFMAYGGGMVGGCYQRGGHAMLVVGHGVENERPYLIIKNSFGADWGINGYFKFDRRFTQECVKDFILPRVSFPSKKAQVRRMKAYDASRNAGSGDADEANDFDIHLENLSKS